MSYQRIVVGVDFSTASLNAVRWVSGQFAPGARIFVVHVVPLPRTPGFLRPPNEPLPDVPSAGPTLYPGLRVFAELAGAGRSDVEIRSGSPAAELTRIAEEVGADLICVGRTRQRRGSGRFGATTPQRLLSRTNIPVLIVPDTARIAPGAVLAAMSDGRDGVEVLRAAGRLAAAWRVRLDALHAIDPDALSYARRSLATSGGDSHCCLLAQEWIVRQVGELPLQGVRVHAIARVGDAGEETIAHAARNNIGLIVAGRRTDDERAGAFEIGSTTRLITWASACPVLVHGTPAVGAKPVAAPMSLPEPWRAAPTNRLELSGGRVVRGLRPPRRVPPGGGGDAA